jgi:hypothetical protein
MAMIGKLLKVLKQNEEYLRHNDFEMLYYKLNEAYAEGVLDPDHIGEFTSWVLSKGKDPMQALPFVPANYLYQEQTAKELCVPEGTEFIYDYTATGSNIEVLYLPKTINRIGEEAFRGCEKLRKIVYGGTLTSFKTIKIKNFAFKDCYVLNRLEASDGIVNPESYLELFNH